MLDCPVGLATPRLAREDRGNRMYTRGQLWQGRHGLYALANNNKPPKDAVISSDLFSRTQKSFFGVFIRLKIEDAKLRQTALGCCLIWSRE